MGIDGIEEVVGESSAEEVPQPVTQGPDQEQAAEPVSEQPIDPESAPQDE